MLPRLFTVFALSILPGLGACNNTPEAPAAAAEPAALTPKAPAAAAAPEAANDGFGPGWSKRSLRDSLPICIFSSFAEREKFPFPQKVGRQTLRANSSFVIGVYPPQCLNEACDARANLQCWIEPEGKTLRVRTSFFSFHNQRTSCTHPCLGVDSACETPELIPGHYTIRHGDTTYDVKVPSVVRSPCLTKP